MPEVFLSMQELRGDQLLSWMVSCARGPDRQGLESLLAPGARHFQLTGGSGACFPAGGAYWNFSGNRALRFVSLTHEKKNIMRGAGGRLRGSSHPTTWFGAFAARTAQTVRSYIHQLSTEMPGQLMLLSDRLRV